MTSALLQQPKGPGTRSASATQNLLFCLLHEERKRYLLLLMRACNVPDTEDLMRLYEDTGDEKYHIEFVKVILDRLIDKMGIRAKLEDPDQKPN